MHTTHLRILLRSLLRNWTFSLAAVITVALGVGASTAIYSVVDAAIIRPLPFPHSSRIVALRSTKINSNGATTPSTEYVANKTFDRWAARNHSFEYMAGWQRYEVALDTTSGPTHIQAGAVTPQFFRLFGAHLVAGRGFFENENQPGEDQVVVLSYALWRDRFSGSPKVIGTTIPIDGVPYIIVGVVGPEFRPVLPNFPLRPFLYVPMSHTFQGLKSKFTVFDAAGLLRPGVSVKQARADMNVVASVLAQETPRFNAHGGVDLVLLRDEVSQQAGPMTLLLACTVGCVLLICCANFANLLLARSLTRSREIAIRSVLGASRARLLIHSMGESAVLVCTGALVAIVPAWYGLHFIVANLPPGTIPRLQGFGVETHIFGTGLLGAVLAGTAMGTLPAVRNIRLTQHSLGDAVKESSTITGGPRGKRLRYFLVVAQVAIAAVLLSTAGNLLQSFMMLRRVNVGFNYGRVLTAEINLPQEKYNDSTKRTQFIERLIENLQHRPGVSDIAITNSLPLGNGSRVGISGVQGTGVETNESINFITTTTNYFRIMGIPLKWGRLLTAADTRSGAVVVDEAFVHAFWPNEQKPEEVLGRVLK